MTPLVSFVIIARNDDYMGDYLYRLGTSVSFLAESARRSGLLDAMEVVIVDWASARPLADDLPLTADARAMTRFLEVTPAIVESVYGSVRWVPTCAVNVGVRRARGEFIFFTDSDCLWIETAVAALGRLLRREIALPLPIGDVMAYVRRYQVPWSAVNRRPRLDEWRRIAALIVAGAQPEAAAASCLGGFSAGQLMHRNLWFEARGYDESLDKPWGWSDNDLMLRVSQRHGWLDVSGYGFFGFHMEHWPTAEARFERDKSTINPMTIRNVPVTNGDDWGMGQVEIASAPSRSTSEPPAGTGLVVPLSGGWSTRLATDWKRAPEALRFVRHIGIDYATAGVPSDQIDAVADLVLRDRPMSVYWFGSLKPALFVTILKACPAAELFVVNPWPEGPSDDLGFHPGEFAGFLEARCGFRGWSRLVQGDPLTAVERIAHSHPGTTRIELAWIGPEIPDDVIGHIVERLAPGGILLTPADTRDADCVGRLAPACTTQLLGNTGLVAATRRS
jgi:hypothetical protein